MKALVTAASKHGATLETAEAITRVLEEHGLSAELIDIDKVRNRRVHPAWRCGGLCDTP